MVIYSPKRNSLNKAKRIRTRLCVALGCVLALSAVSLAVARAQAPATEQLAANPALTAAAPSPAYEAPDPCGLREVVCGEIREVSAYSSEVRQTDSSPTIAADGSDILALYRSGQLTCASNDYPLGTVLEVEGHGTCTVRDRMNRRYTGTGRVDWYMGLDHAAAWEHGVQNLEVTVTN